MSTTENINRAVRAIDALEGEALEQVAAYIYRKQNGVSTVAKLAKVEAENNKLREGLGTVMWIIDEWAIKGTPTDPAVIRQIAKEALQ